MYRTIGGSVFIKWNDQDWTSETQNLIRATGLSRQLARDRGWVGVGMGTVGEARIELRNKDGRYSPDNPNSPLAGSISGGLFRNKEVKVDVEVDSSACTLFTGYLRDLTEDALDNTVSFFCEDRAAILSDQRISTSLMRDLSTGSYVESILIDAGLSASDYDIDYGYARIPFGWMDDEPVWQEMGLAAEVEAGRIYVDRLGVVHFDDSAAMVTAASKLNVILSPSQVGDFRPAYDWASHYNIIRVEYTGRMEGKEGVIYDVDEAFRIHPGETFTHNARLDMPAVTVNTPVNNQDYFIRSAGGLDVSGSMTVNMSTCAQKVELTFQNTGTVFTAFVSGLQLTGILAEGRHTATVSASSGCSVAQYGNLTKEFPFNPLIQDSLHAEHVAKYLRDRLEAPKRLITITDVPGSVTAMPGVLVSYDEPTRTQLSGSGYIVRVDWSLEEGFVMDLGVITSDLFIYPDYFKLDRDNCSGSQVT